MISFLEHMDGRRKYVSVVYSDETQALLRQWCIENGFDLSVGHDGEPQKVEKFEFHTTLFYSKNRVKMKNEVRKESKTDVFINKFGLLGENEDIPVLLVSSGGIDDIREIMAHEHGLKDSWPDYKPHISLSYRAGAVHNFQGIKLPEFRPYFDKIVIEDLDE